MLARPTYPSGSHRFLTPAQRVLSHLIAIVLPMSAFAWLSYSESERQKALDVISLFWERDTRDELGIGVIRDAFADLLFPGNEHDPNPRAVLPS